MAQFTNTAPGARGVNMKDGTTVLVDAGRTVELDKDQVKDLHPDIRSGGPRKEDGGAALDAANAELADQVTALTGQLADLQGKLDAANAELQPHRIRAAVGGLDPKNDAHWTQAGEPKVEAIETAVGAKLIRADIATAAPDAKRPTA